jgi:hypothetical protein
VSASCPAPAPSALLGAGLHLNQLSRFPGPPQTKWIPIFACQQEQFYVVWINHFFVSMRILVATTKHGYVSGNLSTSSDEHLFGSANTKFCFTNSDSQIRIAGA